MKNEINYPVEVIEGDMIFGDGKVTITNVTQKTVISDSIDLRLKASELACKQIDGVLKSYA